MFLEKKCITLITDHINYTNIKTNELYLYVIKIVIFFFTDLLTMSTVEEKDSNRLKKCIKCAVRAKDTSGVKRFVESVDLVHELSEYSNSTINIGDFICAKCFTGFQFVKNKKAKLEPAQDASTSVVPESQGSYSTDTPSSQSSTDDPTFIEGTWGDKKEKEMVELSFPRPVSTHKYCFLCGKSLDISVVPFEARKQVFNKQRIFIPDGNRCCRDHLIKKRFYDDEITRIRVVSNASLVSTDDISRLLTSISLSVDRTLVDQIGDFSISEERLVAFTGLTWENLICLREMMQSLKNSISRNVTQAIVVFLFKLRSGNSNNLISALLGLERPQQVSDFSKSVLRSFEIDVLPKHFGINAISRNHLVRNETALIVKKLHDISDDQLVLIADGSYLRHQKSSNNEYQRKSYSGQKKVPLCKPFTICTSTGYIVDTLGPFLANLNDAEIMKLILAEEDGLCKLLRIGDVFVLDRGFRDTVNYLKDKGFTVLMPSLKGKRNQLTTAEANHSRQVTMIRWVVEAVHGVIGQKYKLLHHQLDNKLLDHASLYCKIACFLVNKFGKRFISNVSTMDEVLIQVKNHPKENTLAQEAENGKWSRRKTQFQKITSTDVDDFPEITENELKILFTGTYQLQQSISYLAEIMNEGDEIDLYYLKQSKDIVKFQVRSRHISRKTYNCYIHYTPNSIGYHGIKRYCCECANGMRTIGCCSHVAAIIYYLSHARYQSKIFRPAEKLSKLFTVEKVQPVIEEDSDDD